MAPSIQRCFKLRSLAARLEALADETAQPSRSIERSDRLIAEAEAIATEVRRAFR